MKYILILSTALLFYSCNSNSSQSQKENAEELKKENFTASDTLTKHLKPFKEDLPTIGLLMYSGVLQSEVVATSDVFSKPDGPDGKQLFNVITIAETKHPITTEEGLTTECL